MTLFTGTPEEVAALRQRIVEEALTWVNTPFHDCAGVKGAGVDCVHLLQRVYQACGIALSFEMPDYPPQWHLHRDEPRFLTGMARYARKVELPGVADVAMFRFGRHAAHGAIVLPGNKIVHASGALRRVAVDDLRPHLARLDSYWSVFA